MNASLLSLLCFSLSIHAPAPKDVVLEREMGKLKGVWLLIGAEEKSIKLTDKEVREEKQHCEISENKIIFIRDRERLECTFKIDPRRKPAVIDIILPDDKGVIHAIYLLEGDELKMCFSKKMNANKKEERPVKFTTNRDENERLPGLLLDIYKRKDAK